MPGTQNLNRTGKLIIGQTEKKEFWILSKRYGFNKKEALKNKELLLKHLRAERETGQFEEWKNLIEESVNTIQIGSR